jgi:membrane protease YdiL (CAAX protease family)
LQAFNSTPLARSNRTLQLALFGTSAIWFISSQALAVHAANGISRIFSIPTERPLLTALFLFFLLAVGFSVLQAIGRQNTRLRDVLGLPRRPTALREWSLGAAIGWGIVVLSVLPMALMGALDVHFWLSPHTFWLLIVNLVTLAVGALVEEVAFRGYPYRRLIEAVGPTTATIGLSVLFGLIHALNPDATWTSVLITMLAGLLLSVAWLRTHGLWLPWGLHFAWNASMGLVFGLPISGLTDFSAIVETRSAGPTWLTGGSYGPEGAHFTAIVLILGIIVVFLVTRDYAWHYTHTPIVPGGYAVDVPPPAAHAAMESQPKAPAPPPPLVQILPATPQGRSSITEDPTS